MDNILTCTVVPCGGMVILDMVSSDTGTWILTRAPATTPSNVYTLYNGPALGLPLTSPMWLDLGDGLNAPLDQSISYIYTFTTSSGSVSQTVSPAAELQIEFDDYLRLVANMLQAGVQAVNLAGGPMAAWQKPSVIISMPLVGTPTLPAISVNEDLLQQEEVPIGHGMNTDAQANLYQIQEIVNRRYGVTVMASSTDERDFWKLVVISVFKSILVQVLIKMGQDISSSFQAANSQVMEPPPGFYFSQIMLEFSGILPLRIITSYPIVENFDIIANDELIGWTV